MKIRLHKKLYTEGISDKKLKAYCKKIEKGSLKLKLFLVTLPIGNQGVLEIYWYPELLQPIYQNMNEQLTVVGIASNRDDACEIIMKIVEDVKMVDDSISIRDYFEENI